MICDLCKKPFVEEDAVLVAIDLIDGRELFVCDLCYLSYYMGIDMDESTLS